jgi:hypothetical protein
MLQRKWRCSKSVGSKLISSSKASQRPQADEQAVNLLKKQLLEASLHSQKAKSIFSSILS